MSQTWVVGVDGSDHARRALAWAVEQARDADVTLQVVNAWQVPTAGVMPLGGPTSAAWEEVAEATRASVDKLVAELVPPGQPAEAIVAQGGAAAVLLDASQGADRLVVGTRGRGGFARLVLGSVSHQVATHAAVPTVVVPASTDPAAPIDHVVVGLDGSANGRAALRWALDHVPVGADVEVVGAWEPSSLGVDELDATYYNDLAEASRKRFDSVLDEILDEGTGGHDVRRAFYYDRAGAVLVDAAAEASLVVVGARGHGAIGAALLGSVSTHVLHHATCPTVVVPAPN